VAAAQFKGETMETKNNRPIYTTIFDNPHDWDADRIREYYDQTPDLLLADFARMTGRTVKELKRVLMEPAR
jgi:hypothetical protein